MTELLFESGLTMNQLRVIAIRFAATVLFVTAGQVQAGILTFDDVPGGSRQEESGNMPSYKGFIFSNQLDWIDVVGLSWNYGAHSGQFAIHKAFHGLTVVHAVGGVDFTFDGLWAKKWNTAPNSGGIDDLFGTIRGVNNGSTVWSIGTGLNGNYEFYGAQSGLIDTLVLDLGEQFLVDDLSLNTSSASVPEPVSASLWAALGTTGLCVTRRGRKRAA